MILRNKKIKPQADEVQVAVSFGLPDVREWMRRYATLFLICGDKAGKELAQSIPVTEGDIRKWMEKDPTVLANWPSVWRDQLSAWAFATAVRHGLLTESATPNRYYLSDECFTKRGRPTAADEEEDT